MSETVGGSTAFRVALTFDAEHPDRSWCPPDNAERILDILASERVRTTMFMQGRWAKSQPATARRIADDGHLVGNHSHYHARMTLMTDAGIEADLADAAAAIEAAAGLNPRPWFRFPFGDGREDTRVVAAVAALGYRNVHWHIELDDWEAWRTGEAIVADALTEIRDRGDGAVVLLHTWPGGTSEALRPMIAGLRDLGASFVTVDELERLP